MSANQGIFVYQRTAALADLAGNEVVVVSPMPYFPRWIKTKRWRSASEVPDEEVVGKLTVHHPRYLLLPKVSMLLHGISMFLGSFLRCAALHKKFHFECIDAHFVYPDGFAAVCLGKALGIPVTVSARGTDINVFPSFRLIRPMIHWTLRECASAVAVSAALKERIVELEISAEKINVIPNGVDPLRFQRLPKTDARRRLHLPESAKVVLSVGSLSPSKGHQFVIRAFQQVSQRHRGLSLYILGEGALRAKLENLVAELNLQHSVQLLGGRPNEELPWWFSAADVSCLHSSREGWPNVVTESLACGTPVVATRVGGIPDILHSPELGVLVEQSVESLAEGIERALSTDWDRERISKQTRERTWHTVAEEVDAVLRAQIQRREE